MDRRKLNWHITLTGPGTGLFDIQQQWFVIIDDDCVKALQRAIDQTIVKEVHGVQMYRIP